MTAPTPKTDLNDAQKFMTSLAKQLDERGYRTMATMLRAEMPDSDFTNLGGSGSEKIISTIVTSVTEQIKEEKNKR
ncbi:hypothetical protein [Dactylosporangium sp. NPDC049140]|uniref:hypothetical protein n=1 Tax=Dactylosporangium sp. NPDC049140 TaxID=3155647 RepID=UPI0033F6B08C